MANQKSNIDEKVAMLGNEIKNQFAKAGEDAKNQLLESFRSVLESDVNNLKSIVDKTAADSSQKMKDQMQTALNQAIKQQFGGSVFGSVLQDLILPTVFNGIAASKVDASLPKFREAASQTLLDIGKSIAKSSGRNG